MRSVNEDPPHVLAPSPYDVGVLGEREVFWGAPDRDPPVYELSFLLKAITAIEVSRPKILSRALPRDAVVAIVRTPTGQTLMVCPRAFASALEAAVTRAKSRDRV